MRCGRRVLHQAAMPRHDAQYLTTHAQPALHDESLSDELFEAAALESIRLLDLLCRGDRPLVSRTFPVLKRFALDEFNMHVQRTRSPHRVMVFVAALQYLLNHHEVVIFNVEPVMEWFFTRYLRSLRPCRAASFGTLRSR